MVKKLKLKILWGRRRDSCCKIVASINNPH
jgi:hypothetical protein